MIAENNPLEAVRLMMVENFANAQRVIKSYLELVMLSMPMCDVDQMYAFKRYLGRQVATNNAFVKRLLRANDFQDVVRIQLDYFQSQMRYAVDDTTQLDTMMVALR